MTYKFTKLNSNATFEDFRKAYINAFGSDYYEFTDEEDIPTGKISEANDEFVKVVNSNVELWIDDGEETVTSID